MLGRHQSRTSSSLERQNYMVFGNSLCQRIGSNRRRADGATMENLPGFTTLGILIEIQKMMAELKCEPEQFQGRIIFMSMYNYITWRTPGNEENCVANSLYVATFAQRFPFGCWSYLGPGCEKSGMELTLTSQMVNGTELLR